MSLILVRHPKPTIPSTHCYGQLDCDLAKPIDPSPEEIMDGMPPPGRLLSSPLKRCLILASQISSIHDLTVETDARLMEMDFGTWEGKPWSDIDRGEIDHWAADFFRARPHGGESVDQLYRRVTSALSEYDSQPMLNTLVITHAGVIRTALACRNIPGAWNSQIAYGQKVVLNENALAPEDGS